jgi:probable F420-dependent oxidoreductase
MSLAYLGNDLQLVSGGRFILGLGTQVKAHIERRYSMPWSRPAARMREMVQAIRAIWESWESGDRLSFEGEFYSHTLSSPNFTPPPNPHGKPKIFLAGVGPVMTEVAGEVADGYFIHPFNSEISMDTLSLPSLERGLAKSGRSRQNCEVSAQVIVATGLDEERYQAAVSSARNQIAFYGSTPAYRPILDAHGWGEMQPRWNDLIRAGNWAKLANTVDDEMLHTFAVVGSLEEVAAKLHRRGAGRLDRASPVVYDPDPELLAAILGALKSSAV